MGKLAISGGDKACNYTWPTWPMWDGAERTAVNEVLESGQWWYGKKVQQFEADYATFQDAKFGVTTNSGTTALEIVYRALGIGPGDEVIVPAYTFIATGTSVVFAGAKPVFADVRRDNLCVDPADVERKITPKTKAIVPVHFAGHVADMDRLLAIGKKHNLPVVEDACHSWGSKWKGQGTGSIGNCGVFSFQVSKNISGAEGGIITTNDERLADACRSLTNCGRVKGGKWYEHGQAGTNVRLTEFQAAILLAQMTRALPHMEQRTKAVAILDKELATVPGLSLLTDDPRHTRRTHHLYCFWFDPKVWGISRDAFLDAVGAEGVPASAGYLTPVYGNLCFQPGENPTNNPCIKHPAKGSPLDNSGTHCPVAEDVCKNIVWFTHTTLLADEAAVRAIPRAIRKVYDNRSELQKPK
jgi:dTDP-4-amino-4,6-dideoxygalactose transaminase